MLHSVSHCILVSASHSLLIALGNGQPKNAGGRVYAHLAIRANLGSLLVLLLGSNRPVNQEQVDIVELEALEGVLDGPEDVVVAVKVVPDLGADEDV